MRINSVYIAILLCLNFVSGIPQILTVDLVINGIRDGIIVYNDKEHCFIQKDDKFFQKECVQEIRRCFFSKNSFVCLK